MNDISRLPIGVLVLSTALATLPARHMPADDSADSGTTAPTVLSGIDVLERDDFALLKDKSAGLITNHTGVNNRGISDVELLHKAEGVNLTILFSPEHGFAGQLDQSNIGDARDSTTGLKIVSLYGETRTPPAENLQELDVLVFDIQDIGARFYTYISTMGNAMHAAAKADVAFVVLDRPNPINGQVVAGPVLDPGLESFVGYHEIAVRHGMTVGELARMFNEEQEIGVDLTVVPVENWNRADYFDATGQMWINPSPNMRNLNQAVLYPGIGLLETTNLSVGRGTDTPFEIIGAPWMDGRQLAAHLNRADLPGVRFVPIEFQPDASKYAGVICQGINIIVTEREKFESVRTGLTIAVHLRKLFPELWEVKSLNRLLANTQVRDAILDGDSFTEIERSYQPRLEEFRKRRKIFLMY